MGWQGFQLNVMQYLLFGISVLLVANRIYIDVRGLRAKISWIREALLIASLIFFLVACALRSILVAENDLNEHLVIINEINSHQIWSRILKAKFAHSFFMIPGIYLNKMDLLFLYHDLSPRDHHPKFFMILVSAWIFVVGGFLVQIITNVVKCIPVNLNWIEDPPGTYQINGCNLAPWYEGTTWGLHMGTDLILYTLPFVIIMQLQGRMSTSQKLSIVSMFGIGFINIFSAVGTMVPVLLYYADSQVNWTTVGLSDMLQPAQEFTAILVVCMPQLRSLYRLLVGTKGTEISPSDEEKGARRTPPTPEWPTTIAATETTVMVDVEAGVPDSPRTNTSNSGSLPKPTEVADNRIIKDTDLPVVFREREV